MFKAIFRFKTVKAAIEHYIAVNPNLAKYSDLNPTITPAALPKEYDNTPYSTIVDGKWVHTVGEYKAETEKWQKYHGG